MGELTYTLVADGGSDRCLIPVLNWVLAKECCVDVARGEYADFARGKRLPDLASKLSAAVSRYPCDWLFIHRDAEREDPESRYEEIRTATEKAFASCEQKPSVCVVPVRMQEAWMLIEEYAIRAAAGNPNGRTPLNVPAVKQLEDLTDPKKSLHDLLRVASGKSGRRLKKFDAEDAASRVSDHILDFSPLRSLRGFRRLCDDVRKLHQSSPANRPL